MTGSDAAKRSAVTHARERTYCRTRSKNAVDGEGEPTGASLSRKRARSGPYLPPSHSVAGSTLVRDAPAVSDCLPSLIGPRSDRSHPLDNIFDRVAGALERTRRSHAVVRPEPFEH